MCTVGLGVAGLVRASTQLARAYGTGRGGQDADEPGDRPEVVIGTGEPLDDLPRGGWSRAAWTRLRAASVRTPTGTRVSGCSWPRAGGCSW
jgi:hypothetical protein